MLIINFISLQLRDKAKYLEMYANVLPIIVVQNQEFSILNQKITQTMIFVKLNRVVTRQVIRHWRIILHLRIYILLLVQILHHPVLCHRIKVGSKIWNLFPDSDFTMT